MSRYPPFPAASVAWTEAFSLFIQQYSTIYGYYCRRKSAYFLLCWALQPPQSHVTVQSGFLNTIMPKTKSSSIVYFIVLCDQSAESATSSTLVGDHLPRRPSKSYIFWRSTDDANHPSTSICQSGTSPAFFYSLDRKQQLIKHQREQGRSSFYYWQNPYLPFDRSLHMYTLLQGSIFRSFENDGSVIAVQWDSG